MKNPTVVLLLFFISINSFSQSQFQINLATGVTSIEMDTTTYINIPLKIEAEYVVIPKLSVSFHVNLERSINKDVFNKRKKITEACLNINYGIIGDMDIGSSLIANLGFGFFDNSKRISSNLLRYGLTAQKEFTDNKFLFVNANYFSLFGEPSNREGYYKNKFGLYAGIKFILN